MRGCFSSTFFKIILMYWCAFFMLWGLIGQGLICEGENSLYFNGAIIGRHRIGTLVKPKYNYYRCLKKNHLKCEGFLLHVLKIILMCTFFLMLWKIIGQGLIYKIHVFMRAPLFSCCNNGEGIGSVKKGTGETRNIIAVDVFVNVLICEGFIIYAFKIILMRFFHAM